MLSLLTSRHAKRIFHDYARHQRSRRRGKGKICDWVQGSGARRSSSCKVNFQKTVKLIIKYKRRLTPQLSASIRRPGVVRESEREREGEWKREYSRILVKTWSVDLEGPAPHCYELNKLCDKLSTPSLSSFQTSKFLRLAWCLVTSVWGMCMGNRKFDVYRWVFRITVRTIIENSENWKKFCVKTISWQIRCVSETIFKSVLYKIETHVSLNA